LTFIRAQTNLKQQKKRKTVRPEWAPHHSHTRPGILQNMAQGDWMALDASQAAEAGE
jgi:hypothetical protein